MTFKEFLMNGFRHPYAKTLPELLEYTASSSEGTITIYRSEENFKILSYNELYVNARKYAGAYKNLNKNRSVLLAIEDSYSFLIALWGCILSGGVAVPLQPLKSEEINNKNYSRIVNICSQYDGITIVSDDDNIKYYRDMIDANTDLRLSCISISELENGKDTEPEKLDENDTVIVQYSSGSTGIPKGVKITHKNVMTSLGSVVCHLQMTDKTKTTIRSPHFHNMGLFINMLLMQVGGYSTICSPSLFIQNPTKFLQIVADDRADIVTRNNFGLEWMIKNVDTSKFNEDSFKSIKAFIVASEVVSDNTVKRFYDKFCPLGVKFDSIKACYGLSETTLAVTMTPLNDSLKRLKNINNDGTILVGVGNPLPGFEVSIMNEDGNFLNDDEYGEIVVRSDSVSEGYVMAEDENVNFKINGWLNTGDIGFIHEGEVFISGRKKEMFIVRGHNYMIHDIEHEILEIGNLSADNIMLCSSYDSDKNMEVLLLFYNTEKSDELIEKIKNINSSLISKYGFGIEKAIGVKTFARTGTGKINRNAMVGTYKSSSYIDCFNLNSISGNKTRKNNKNTSNEAVIRNIWSEVLEIDKDSIDNNVPFYDYGGNSVKQYQMLEKLNKTFDLNLKMSFLRQFITISEIAEGLFTDFEDEDDNDYYSNSSSDNDIAITGVSFRLPGAENFDELWDMLVSGKSCVSKVSEKRRKLAGRPNWNNWICEVEDVDMFDAEFFGIPENESIFMDPQHRLIFETAYEALEDSGEAFITEIPRNIGVYSALDNLLYLTRVIDHVRKNGLENVPPNTLVSNLMNISSARITHFFNFSGPAVAMDSACSSFLTALHTARKAIQNGEISSAVISTAHLAIIEEEFQLANQAGIISKSNRSKVFDKDADGSVLGEGVISVFVEPLKNAVKAKKHIYAVIKGSAVNNDGYSLSIMAPNPDGQFDVLKLAYKNAKINPEEISYIEAHGTGTKIGDPIEFRALNKFFSNMTKKELKNATIGIGSMKSNIGHLFPAASGAGLVKLIACFEHRMLVPSAELENINPALGIDKSPFFVVTEPVEWKTTEGMPRTAGITSLGLGGTNAHMILQEYENRKTSASFEKYPLVISAKTQEALDKKIIALKEYIKNNHDSIGDICYTLCKGRMAYKYRAAAVIESKAPEKCFDDLKFAQFSRIKKPEIYLKLNADIKYNEQIEKIISVLKNFKGIIINDKVVSVTDWKNNNIIKDNETENKIPKNSIIISTGIDYTDNALNISDFSDRNEIINLLNEIFFLGGVIDWEKVDGFAECGIVPLPKYPFNNRSYWI